jgi:glycosyltransferase involved in cell wall biosynthesis
LIVVPLESSVGGSEARNVGARLARGVWVALLDDDDEWLPNRLERQLQRAAGSTSATMVVSRFIDRGGGIDLERPTRFPRVGEEISEFLWADVSMLGGICGFPQTSTWLVKRDFLLQVPFTKGLRALQDLDWLLHAYRQPGMHVIFVDEVLTIFNNEQSRDRVAKRIEWQFSYDWAHRNRELFTSRAFAFFLIIYCVNPAAQQGAPLRRQLALLRECYRLGEVTPRLLVLFALYSGVYPLCGMLLPKRARSRLLYQFKLLLHGKN